VIIVWFRTWFIYRHIIINTSLTLVLNDYRSVSTLLPSILWYLSISQTVTTSWRTEQIYVVILCRFHLYCLGFNFIFGFLTHCGSLRTSRLNGYSFQPFVPIINFWHTIILPSLGHICITDTMAKFLVKREQSIRWLRNTFSFMEPEGSLLCS
jgi:hypothetical protein